MAKVLAATRFTHCVVRIVKLIPKCLLNNLVITNMIVCSHEGIVNYFEMCFFVVSIAAIKYLTNLKDLYRKVMDQSPKSSDVELASISKQVFYSTEPINSQKTNGDGKCPVCYCHKPGTERFVLNFTLRDSPNDTINAMCWGEEGTVKGLSTNFAIGDVVRIRNPQIIEKQAELQDDKFRPSASSNYVLNLSPLYTEITVSDGHQSLEYKKLLHCSMHNSSEIISLADVIYNSQNADGLTLNLLVAVKDIKPLQTVKLKTNREVKKLLMSVFDQTHPTFPITIWDEETANFILRYAARKTILLISGIKIGYNTFLKEMAGTAGSSTVFTPEPEIPDARVLYQHAMKTMLYNENAEIQYLDSSKTYTIGEIYNVMSTSELELDEMEGRVHAVLSAFDIDGLSKITTLKCPGCYLVLQNPSDNCTNGVCEVGSGMKIMAPEEMYHITVSLMDDTGNLPRCLLGGQTVEKLLGLKVKEFNALSDEDKTTLKWRFLFEWFNIHFKVSQSLAGNGRLNFRILEIQKDE